nr:immunoglobulin heavy chain junction region [Macaca mulatta]
CIKFPNYYGWGYW